MSLFQDDHKKQKTLIIFVYLYDTGVQMVKYTLMNAQPVLKVFSKHFLAFVNILNILKNTLFTKAIMKGTQRSNI